MHNKEHEKFVNGFLRPLHKKCLEAMFPVRGKLGINVKNIDAMESSLALPFKIFIDQNTNEEIKGKNPVKYFPLINSGKEGSATRRETSFNTPVKDERGNFIVIPWRDLNNVTMQFVPTFCFKSIYYGSGKGSIQFEMVSAIVHDIVPNTANVTEKQKNDLEALSHDEVLSRKLKAQLEALSSRKTETKKDDDLSTPQKSTANSSPSSSTPSSSSSFQKQQESLINSTNDEFEKLMNSVPKLN
jgi:hypothetical protein